jgi:integral membrane protein (TIGR00529 family)
MEILSWTGFAGSLLVLFTLSRWSVGAGMFAGAVVLGLFTLPLSEAWRALAGALVDPGVWLLGLAVSLIPLIGAALERTGRMATLVDNLPLGKRSFFGFIPALFGLLPMPGGALLSAPFLERVGGPRPEIRAAINVWFRHTLLLIYPISSSLIAAARLAGLDVWQVIPYQLPSSALAIAVGYLTLLRGIPNDRLQSSTSLRRALTPLGAILIAPLIDYVLKHALSLPVPELATVIGVGASLALAGWGLSRAGWRGAIRGAKPWRFGLIILGMFAYLGVFQASGVSGLIASLPLPPQALTVGVGFVLGFLTGRIQAPLSILIPVYLAKFGNLGPWAFAISYFAVYLGYIISPVHPCLVVSVEYAKTTLGATIKTLLAPTALALSAVVLVSIWGL